MVLDGQGLYIRLTDLRLGGALLLAQQTVFESTMQEDPRRRKSMRRLTMLLDVSKRASESASIPLTDFSKVDETDSTDPN